MAHGVAHGSALYEREERGAGVAMMARRTGSARMGCRVAPALQWAYVAVVSALLLALAGCGVGGGQGVTPAVTAAITPVARPEPAVMLGAAVQYDALKNDQHYRQLVRDDFVMVTPENEMKIGAVEPALGVFDFTRADAIVTFARANGLFVRGHTLVWGQGLPGWLVNGHFTRDQATAILKAYIQAIVGRYRGEVVAWDVVNEAMDGSQLADNYWLRTIGPDYIPLAFQWAHAADPHAKLFYNDWGDDEVGPKFDAIFSLVTSLRKQGVPIDGVGIESHIGFGAAFQPQAVVTNMARLKAAGLDVEVSEIDVQIGALPGSTTQQLQEQADIYGQMASICRAAGNCHIFTTWGVCDRYTWISQVVKTPQEPLLFSASYQPKPAYAAVVHALGGV